MRLRHFFIAVTFTVATIGLSATSYAQIAQPGTPTQQVPTHADACTPLNSQAASGSQTTLTIPAPQGNQYIYIAEIDIEYMVGTALGAVQASNTTTTNLGGLKWSVTMPVTANTNYKETYQYPTGMRSITPGTAVTIVGIAGVANLTQTVNACFWYGF